MSDTSSTCSSCCSDEVLEETSVSRVLLFKVLICVIFTTPLLLHMFSNWQVLHMPVIQLALCIPVLVVGFLHFGKSALNSIKAGHSNMDVLITIGFSSAFFYSLWGVLVNQPEKYLFFETSASIITYVLIGNYIEHRATKNTSSSIKEFVTLTPKKAKRISKAGIAEIIEEIDANLITDQDTILVNLGDSIPADGIVIKSDALVNQSIITGESLAVEKQTGDKVYTGTVVEKGSLVFKVEASGENTLFSEILRTIKTAKNAKPNIQRLGDKVSEIFVPLVLAISFLTFLFTQLFSDITLTESLLRAIAVLVVACPCAMGLATPTAVMVAVGRAAKKGVLVKGGDIFERLTEIKEVIFDKTGTLTDGKFKIKELKTFGQYTYDFTAGIIKSLESFSNHPLATSLVDNFKSAPNIEIKNITEHAGLMVSGVLDDGREVKFGSKKIIFPLANIDTYTKDNFDLFLVIDNQLACALTLEDILREDANSVINYLSNNKIKSVLLSGDSKNKCQQIANNIKIDDFFYEKNPSEKLEIIKHKQSKNSVAYVGDGVNDAPSLSIASVGVSFANASKSAVASAGAVILSSELSKIKYIFELAKHTVLVIKQNLFWAFFYNSLMIPLAIMGFLTPSIAALAMGLSDLFVIGNSLRLKVIKLDE